MEGLTLDVRKKEGNETEEEAVRKVVDPTSYSLPDIRAGEQRWG
jgi:hypothetical protein